MIRLLLLLRWQMIAADATFGARSACACVCFDSRPCSRAAHMQLATHDSSCSVFTRNAEWDTKRSVIRLSTIGSVRCSSVVSQWIGAQWIGTLQTQWMGKQCGDCWILTQTYRTPMVVIGSNDRNEWIGTNSGSQLLSCCCLSCAILEFWTQHVIGESCRGVIRTHTGCVCLFLLVLNNVCIRRHGNVHNLFEYLRHAIRCAQMKTKLS